jgi:hypothetical protein
MFATTHCQTFAISILACAFLVQSPATLQSPDQLDSYPKLVERVKAGDHTVSFMDLRFAYDDYRTNNKVPDVTEQRKAMNKSLNSKDYKTALGLADKVLAVNFVDMDAHMVAYAANLELKVKDQAEFHKRVFQGLLQSIVDSGTGKAPETGWHVIDVHEEYIFLRAMGVVLPQSQSLIRKNGHAYDEIKFKNPKTGELQTVYFNVDVPASHGL